MKKRFLILIICLIPVAVTTLFAQQPYHWWIEFYLCEPQNCYQTYTGFTGGDAAIGVALDAMCMKEEPVFEQFVLPVKVTAIAMNCGGPFSLSALATIGSINEFGHIAGAEAHATGRSTSGGWGLGEDFYSAFEYASCAGDYFGYGAGQIAPC